MEIIDGNKMKGGWFIGDFEPSVLKTKEFEVCYKKHHQHEKWPIHIHKITTEINFLMTGSMLIAGRKVSANQIFIIHPGEIADPVFLEDCELIVVKIPSIPKDKHTVEDNYENFRR